MPRIELDNVSLTFRVRRDSQVTLKEYVVKQMFRPSRNPRFEVKALQNISIAVEQGQRLGVVGHNGAGKSTLLRTLAGVYPPTEGRRVVEGTVSSLFEIALGFEREANGWENIKYRSYLQGETPKTMKKRSQEIAEFSELGEFLEMPVRYYSSGMMVRLAFSIATAIEPEVLLVDEALGAGDMAFREKARARMAELIKKASVLVVVTHDLGSLEALCDRVLWLDHGCMKQIGPVDEVLEGYKAYQMERIAAKGKKAA